MRHKKNIGERQVAEAEIRERYRHVKENLDERSRRLFVTNEAMAFGYGGIGALANATGVSRDTISKGIQELLTVEAGTYDAPDEGHIRRAGGGRKKATTKDPTLLSDLQT